MPKVRLTEAEARKYGFIKEPAKAAVEPQPVPVRPNRRWLDSPRLKRQAESYYRRPQVRPKPIFAWTIVGLVGWLLGFAVSLLFCH